MFFDLPNMRCYFGPLAPRAWSPLSQTNMAKWREKNRAGTIMSRGTSEYERGIGPAEPEGVRQNGIDVTRLGRVWHEIDRGLD